MQWLFLVYKIPREPSALRVGVWRKLGKLGAVLSHDSVWVLPKNARTREQFQWLAAEIIEQGGSATVWAASATLEGQDAVLERAFLELVEPAYKEILTELKSKQANLIALSRRFQQVQAQDHLHSKLGVKVRAALLKARGRPV